MTKVGRKGVVVIPKALREVAGIEEAALVVLTAEEGGVAIRPLKPVRVEATPEARRALEEALGEELALEEEKAGRVAERR